MRVHSKLFLVGLNKVDSVQQWHRLTLALQVFNHYKVCKQVRHAVAKRREQSRADQSREEQSRAAQCREKQIGVERSRAVQCGAERSRSE